MHLITHPVPLFLSFVSLLCQAIPLMMQILHLLYHLLCLHDESSGDGSTDMSIKGDRGRGLVRLKKENWHQERISPELFISEPIPPPFTWALVLVTPIEFHSDIKHIIYHFLRGLSYMTLRYG